MYLIVQLTTWQHFVQVMLQSKSHYPVQNLSDTSAIWPTRNTHFLFMTSVNTTMKQSYKTKCVFKGLMFISLYWNNIRQWYYLNIIHEGLRQLGVRYMATQTMPRPTGTCSYNYCKCLTILCWISNWTEEGLSYKMTYSKPLTLREEPF